jgi:hypothetical protein
MPCHIRAWCLTWAGSGDLVMDRSWRGLWLAGGLGCRSVGNDPGVRVLFRAMPMDLITKTVNCTRWID